MCHEKVWFGKDEKGKKLKILISFFVNFITVLNKLSGIILIFPRLSHLFHPLVFPSLSFVLLMKKWIFTDSIEADLFTHFFTFQQKVFFCFLSLSIIYSSHSLLFHITQEFKWKLFKIIILSKNDQRTKFKGYLNMSVIIPSC